MPDAASRPARSVADQPSVALANWHCMETADGRRHFIGYCIENVSVRVSTAVTTFDVAQLIAVTESGRAYRLQGPPGANVHALNAWREWADRHGLPPWRAVSQEIWTAHLAANWKEPKP